MKKKPVQREQIQEMRRPQQYSQGNSLGHLISPSLAKPPMEEQTPLSQEHTPLTTEIHHCRCSFFCNCNNNNNNNNNNVNVS